MLPTAHLLWSSLWLGLAEEASWRAQRFVQKAARKDPGTVPPGAIRLAALMVTRQEFAATVDSLMTRYLSIMDDPEATSAVDFMVAINTLKISASTEVVDVVNQALLICGIQGYREDSEYSLGRHPARRPRRRGHGQQRPHRRQHRPARAGPAGD